MNNDNSNQVNDHGSSGDGTRSINNVNFITATDSNHNLDAPPIYTHASSTNNNHNCDELQKYATDDETPLLGGTIGTEKDGLCWRWQRRQRLRKAEQDTENERCGIDKTLPANYRQWLKTEIWEFVKLASVVSLTTACRYFMSATDTAFLGRVSNTAQEAAGLSIAWRQILVVLYMGPAVLLNSLVSQAMGANQFMLVGVWLQYALIAGTALASVMIALLFITDDIVVLFKQDTSETVKQLALTYSEYSAIGVLPTMLYLAIRMYFQAQGIIYPALVVSILCLGVNYGLNQVFIFGFGKNSVWEGLGFVGSPLATAATMWIQLVLYSIYVIVIRKHHRKTWGGWKLSSFTKSRTKTYVKQMIPTILFFALDEWVYSVVVFMTTGIGSTKEEVAINVDVNTILTSIFAMMWAVFWGCGLATQVRVGNYLGAKQPSLAKHATAIGGVFVSVTTAVTCILIYFLRYEIPKIYSVDPDVISEAAMLTPLFIGAFVGTSLALWALAALEGMSKQYTISIVCLIASWGVVFPMTYAFVYHTEYGLNGVWYAIVAGEGVRFILSVVFLVCANWDKMAIRAAQNAEATGS